MKDRLLAALLSVAVLAAPVLAQDDHDAPPSAGAPDGAPANQTSGSGEGKLYLKLKKGGEVIFKKKEGKGKGKSKIKYKGYAKKGLAKYKKAAEEKRLDKGAAETLGAQKRQKAAELASEAELNEDVTDTLEEKIHEAKAAGEEEQAKKYQAAAESSKAVAQNIARKMKAFEAKEAAGKKVFKEPAGAGAPGARGSDGTGGGPDSGQSPAQPD